MSHTGINLQNEHASYIVGPQSLYMQSYVLFGVMAIRIMHTKTLFLLINGLYFVDLLVNCLCGGADVAYMIL